MTDHPLSASESVGDVVKASLRGEVPRRDFLRRVVLLGLSSSAAYQLLDETNVTAQQPGPPKYTTFALGEEGNPPSRPSPNPPSTGTPGRVTTRAIGEETSQPKPRPTTLAVGEESRPQATTMAVGEESPARPTTKAVGEEQPTWSKPKITTYGVGEETYTPPRTATTLRVGEENSPPAPKPQRPSPFPNVTTYAVGEENTRRVPSSAPDLLKRLPRPWKNFRRW